MKCTQVVVPFIICLTWTIRIGDFATTSNKYVGKGVPGLLEPYDINVSSFTKINVTQYTQKGKDRLIVSQLSIRVSVLLYIGRLVKVKVIRPLFTDQ